VLTVAEARNAASDAASEIIDLLKEAKQGD
jgi:hypothetical protein